jgi:hypothetical protein
VYLRYVVANGVQDVIGRRHFASEDLARRPQRKLVDQPHVPRVLVGGDPLLGEGAQVVDVRRRAGLE